MTDTEFWDEVRRRRNHFFLWWIGWPIGGMAAVGILTAIMHHEPTFPIMIGVMFAWYIARLLLVRRLKSLSCPNCSKLAIANPYFTMRHAKCQHCGLQYGSSVRPSPLPVVEAQPGMVPSSIVGLIWAYIVISSAIQGFNLPNSPIGREFPLPTIIVFFPFLLFVVFTGPSVPGKTSIGSIVDRRFGKGTYLGFMRRLRMELLFATMALEIGCVGLMRSFQLNAGHPSFVVSWFFINGGIAFLIIHFISRRRGIYGQPPPNHSHERPGAREDKR